MEVPMSQAAATTTPRERRGNGPVLVPLEADASQDAGQMLEALHQRVEREFRAYEAAEGSHVRQHRAVRAIARALATHVTVEDELLYPALRAQTGRHDGEVERQRQQDHVLDLLLVELGAMVPSERSYDAKVQVLMQVFRQHADEAEALVRDVTGGYLEPAERKRLGLRMLGRIGELEGRPRRGW
jgi:hypothetical protein